MRYTLIVTAILIACTQMQAQTYVPTTGGTMTGNLNMNGVQINAPFYGFNGGFAQPSTSATVSIFTNNNSNTVDFVGWNSGWRFIPVNASSYKAPVITFSPGGNIVLGDNTAGFAGGNTALTIKGPNNPANSGSYQDISYSFTSAGSSRIRSYRGSSWGTYLQFLVNKNGQGSDAPTVAMHIDESGIVGIGTTVPNANSSLHIKGVSSNAAINLETNNSLANWQLVSVQSTNNFAIIDLASSGVAPFVINKGTPNNTMNLTNNGNVLINVNAQTNTSYKLEVGGAARANKVVVNTTGADFVFDSSYRLKDLTEVAAFIDSSKHLPDIASAAEMQKDGLDLGDNQTKLLQKIEELTLYLIEQKKTIELLSKEVADLKKVIKN